jgi:putative Holliday junction resolvase
MKYIGIDYGKKRIGIAVSDENGQFALPKEVFANDDKLIEKICLLVKEVKAEAIIIGESKDYKGKDNLIMKEINMFKEKLGAVIPIPIHFEPEFMTSFAAQRFQGKNALHDASAAALILQSFLDRGGSLLNKATNPHQYDSIDLQFSKEGQTDSPTRKYFHHFLLPELNVLNAYVLDIGCGFGQLFPFLKENRAEKIAGIDPSKIHTEFVKSHYPYCSMCQCTLEEYSSNDRFDIIISIMVFEHIKDIDKAFEKVKSLLKEKGTFYLIVGDKDYSSKPRLNYQLETQKLPNDSVVTKTKRSWGTIYDIFRPVNLYVIAAQKVGLSCIKRVPLIPNQEIIKFIPQYRDFVGITTGHMLILKKTLS